PALKKARTSLANPTATANDGLLADLEVQEIAETETREDKRRDVDHFFHLPMIKEVNGKQKKYCRCKICP
ncbi:hypothetical protein H0H92_003285, partial [Tricholoma furcatifolium]